MYHIPYFKAANSEEVIAFMHAHPFVILTGVDKANKPVATHVPVMIEERDGKIFLLAHIMRKQDHAIAFEANPNVMAIFYGAHTYVSASWYEEKKQASTWNYQTVHAKGLIKFTGEEALRSLLTKLTEKYENNPHSPALVQKMDEQYITSNMKAIIAFEIEVTSLEHVFKLSQNHDEKNYDNIIHHLSSADGDAKAVAAVMQKRKDKI